MANKMTHKDYYNSILTKYALTEAEKEFIKGRIEAIDKKASASKGKETAKDKEREKLLATLYAEMEYGEKYTITDMMKTLPSVKECTNQKVSALMRTFIERGLVARTEAKGKAYFEKVEPTDSEE